MNTLFPPAAAETAASPSDTALCERCNSPFTRRKHGGGSVQRFCGAECRREYRRPPNPAPPAPDAVEHEAAIQQPSPETRTSGVPKPSDEPEQDWEWWLKKENDETIIQRELREVAIYRNYAGDITFRSRPYETETRDDVFIVIGWANLAAVINRLKQIAQEA